MTAAPLCHAGVGDFRAMMSAFPTGVAVITANGKDGLPRGLTCSSLTSVTLTPPTLLVCVTTASSTLAAILATGTFAVNLLHSRAERTAIVFAAPGADRFAEVVWSPEPSTGLPHLEEDAFAMADCQVAGAAEVSDHTVVLGQVARIAHTPDHPLLYGLRRFCPWPRHVPVEQVWNSRSSVL